MNVRLRHSMIFTAGVFYGGKMHMNHYTATFYMYTNTVEPENHNTAFERMKYFVYNVLDSTIFINQQHVEQCQLYLNAGLSITTMPGEPVDQLVGIMLHHKLNAIMEDRIIVDETEICSALGDNMVYLHGDFENADQINKPEWWDTADLVHYDTTLSGSDKIVSMRQNSQWRDVDLVWPNSGAADNTGNTVVFADFKQSDETK